MGTSAGVGLSTADDAAHAARQAAHRALESARIGRADWAVVFATAPHRPRYAALLAALQDTLRTESITGCSAWGVLIGQEEVEGRPAVAVLAARSDRLSGTTLLAPVGEDRGPGAALEIGRRIAGGSDPGLLVLLPDPFALEPDPFLRELARAAPGIEAIGAPGAPSSSSGATSPPAPSPPCTSAGACAASSASRRGASRSAIPAA